MPTAYFVKHPRRMEDLRKPHQIGDERPYMVAKEIMLARIDYENFITDMVVDRQFIEENADLCAEGTPMKCLFVRQRGKKDGVLVVPKGMAYVGWAAYTTTS